MKRALLALLLITLFAAACGSDDDSSSDSAASVDDSASSEASVGADAIATESEDTVAAGPAEDARDSSTESGSDDGAAAPSSEEAAESDSEPAADSEATGSTSTLSEPVAGATDTDTDSSSPDTVGGGTDADAGSAESVGDRSEAGGSADEELAADFSGSATTEDAGGDRVGTEPAAPPVVEATPAPAPTPARPAQAGTLTAADVDDNLNFDFFNQYLGRIQQQFGQTLPAVQLFDRVIIDVVGPDGIGVGNAAIAIDDQRGTSVFTNSAGRAYLYPTYLGVVASDSIAVTITDATGSTVFEQSLQLQDLNDDRSITIEVDQAHTLPPAALDVALVLDTTGSMSDELRYLTTEFESIVSNLRADYGNVDMRFALIAYRDFGDDFVTQTFDFTDDVQQMVARIADQQADGGGDYPEAMDQALLDANTLSWRNGDVARVLILNADAPPHDNAAAATLDLANSLAQQGVRLYPLAASGVGDSAEYLMRLMAATSGGRHMFLTDDSGVGLSHQEPKTECYVVTHLNELIRRVLASELAGERIEAHPSSILRSVGQYDRGHCV